MALQKFLVRGSDCGAMDSDCGVVAHFAGRTFSLAYYSGKKLQISDISIVGSVLGSRLRLSSPLLPALLMVSRIFLFINSVWFLMLWMWMWLWMWLYAALQSQQLFKVAFPEKCTDGLNNCAKIPKIPWCWWSSMRGDVSIREWEVGMSFVYTALL